MIFNYISSELFEGKQSDVNISVKDSNIHDAVIRLDGYKHSMVQIIALCVATKSVTLIRNPPLVSDTHVLIGIINELGGRAKLSDRGLYIDARNICNKSIPFYLGMAIHGSMYLCPSLLIALGEFEYFGSGGCQIGDSRCNNSRPFNHLISVMSAFGASISINDRSISGKYITQNRLNEIDIMDYSTNKNVLSGPLVGGATKTAILMSIYQKSFLIKNAYLKTDVLDMIRYIRQIGKRVSVVGNDIHIQGDINTQEVVEFSLTQCISELVTYASLAVVSKVKVRFPSLNKSVIELGLKTEFEYFEEMGINCTWDGNELVISPDNIICHKNIDVLPDTIQSDHHLFFTLMLLFANEKSIIREYVWTERFQYINNLRKMGAKININNNTIEIYPSSLTKYDKTLLGLDVRTSAVTLLTIIVSGSSATLHQAEHIFRGYSRLKENLLSFGVEILIQEQ